MIRSVITATGSHIPATIIPNEAFLSTQFFTPQSVAMPNEQSALLTQFKAITGIGERRYAHPDQQASDLGLLAASQALTTAGIDPETLGHTAE